MKNTNVADIFKISWAISKLHYRIPESLWQTHMN